MLQAFFGQLGKPPGEVQPAHVLAWAHGIGASGREPSAVTIGARIACLSSFYRFLIRMGLDTANPCDALERPKIQPSPPRGLSAEEVRRFLTAIPNSRSGRRDRAIVLTLVLTGRRRAEVLTLTVGDIEPGESPMYRYRGKGGKRGRRELPHPALEATESALAAFGKALDMMGAGRSAVAVVGRSHRRRDQWHVLRQFPPLPGARRSAPGGHPHPAAHRGEAAPGRGGAGGGRERVSGPQLLGGNDHVPAATRGPCRSTLGDRGGSDWGGHGGT